MTSWNDDRIDELSRRVDNGFKSVDTRLTRVEREVKEGFARMEGRLDSMDQRFVAKEEVNERFDKVDREMGRLNDRFDRFLHTMVVTAGGLIGTLFVAAVGLIVQS